MVCVTRCQLYVIPYSMLHIILLPWCTIIGIKKNFLYALMTINKVHQNGYIYYVWEIQILEASHHFYMRTTFDHSTFGSKPASSKFQHLVLWCWISIRCFITCIGSWIGWLSPPDSILRILSLGYLTFSHTIFMIFPK